MFRFNGSYFTTDSFKTNDNGDDTLGRNDLQVKEIGFLVVGKAMGIGLQIIHYKKVTGGIDITYEDFKPMVVLSQDTTLNLSSKTLVNWNSTSNGIRYYLKVRNGSGNNSSLGSARIYDPPQH